MPHELDRCRLEHYPTKTHPEIEAYIDTDINEGDSVLIIDGSGLKCKGNDEDVFIVYSYPGLTGQGDKLKDIEGTVVKTGVTGIHSKDIAKIGKVYSLDVIIKLGNAEFYTCSAFLTKTL